jgi:hypothetical protein
LKALALLCLLGACRQGPGVASPHPDPSCSDAAYNSLAADCAADAAACVVAGGTETACGALCDDRAREWRERCQ